MKYMKKLVLIVICLSAYIESPLYGQDQDSMSVSVSSGVLVSSQGFNPFYLVHNRLGKVKDHENTFLEGNIYFSKAFTSNWTFRTGGGIRNAKLYELFGSFLWRDFELFVGRKPEVLGGIENNKLTTGSLALGQNAIPITQLNLSLKSFKAIPLTFNLLEFKGGISHGKFERDRFVESPTLHQKYVSFRLNLEKEAGFKVSGSLIHIAQFGGITQNGDQLPNSFEDFLRVATGRGIPGTIIGQGGESNGLGNHMGITEYTLDIDIGKNSLLINAQKPFEDDGGMNYTPVKDLLVGVKLIRPDSKIRQLYLEFFQTIWQSGPGIPDRTDKYITDEDNFGFKYGGRDDFYNNYLYQSGLTYQGRILSNPLFLTYNWSQNFEEPFANYENEIINNRIRAFHFGSLIQASQDLLLRTMMTYSINYGTYAGLYEGRFAWEGIQTDPDFEYVFLGGKNQFYSLVEGVYDTQLFKQPVKLKAMLAGDFGQLYNNVGMELGIEFLLSSY